MAYKILAKSSSGSSTEAGADDYDKFARIYQGQNLDSTDPIQTLQTTFPFADNKFLMRNPANTFSYNHRTAAITANRDVNWPLLTSGDTVVFNDHAATLAAKILAGARVSNYLDVESTSAPASPSPNVIRLYRDPSNNKATVKKSDGSIVDLEAAGAGGGATDLNSLTDVAITTAARGNILLRDATQWVNKVKGAAKQVLAMDDTATDPTYRNVEELDSDTYLRTQRTQKWGDHALTTAAGGSGMWSNGFLTSFGSFDRPLTSVNGLRGRFFTGTVSDNQAGFNTIDVFTRRSNLQKILFKIAQQSPVASVQGYIGLISGTIAVPTSTDPLNARHGIGVWINAASSTNYQIAKNDGIGATEVLAFTSPKGADQTTAFEIRADNSVPNWTIVQDGTAQTFSTNVPDDSNLWFICYIQTKTTASKELNMRYCEFRGGVA